MVSSRAAIARLSTFCARVLLPLFFVVEMYLQIFVIAPVIFEYTAVYYLYLSLVIFLVINIFGNLLRLMLTKTSVEVDTCTEPELNVRLCNMCDRSVPPRCIHCNECNECIPRRRAHCPIVGKCIGYFNHRYFFICAIYTLLYSANTVAIEILFYQRILVNCVTETAEPIDYYPKREGSDCILLYIFFTSAFTNFFILIFAIFFLTSETEVILTGKLTQEVNEEKCSYNHGLKKNLVCVLGKRWYFACLCPIVKSKLPDMHVVLYPVGERQLPIETRL